MAQYCAGFSIEHYLPLRRETKVYQRRRVTVDKPIFPGYCFVNFRPEQKGLIRKAPYVAGILIPPDESHLVFELDQIRQALAADPLLTACDSLQQGRHVRITGGPFLGIEGSVADIHGTTKVRLNVEMIGQAVSVEVPREYIEVLNV